MRERREIEELLRRVYSELQSDELSASPQRQRDFVFHMTDWLDDLEGLIALYGNERSSPEEAAKFIVGFLYHVIPHINAAGKLLLGDVSNPFERGADE